MKIGIVGIGVVGSAVASGLSDLGHSMFLHDIKYKSSIIHIDMFIKYIFKPPE